MVLAERPCTLHCLLCGTTQNMCFFLSFAGRARYYIIMIVVIIIIIILRVHIMYITLPRQHMKRRTALTRARARDNIIILYDDDEYLVPYML